MPRGRPRKQTYHSFGIGNPSSVKRFVKTETRKEVKKEIKIRGRPKSGVQSMQVVGGKLRVKLAKTRTIRVGGKMVKI